MAGTPNQYSAFGFMVIAVTKQPRLGIWNVMWRYIINMAEDSA
jgi:hypothetical protein